MADVILLAAIGCIGIAGLLAFLRHAYHPAPTLLHLEPPPSQRHAFLGSIAVFLAMGVVMLLLWWALEDFPDGF